MKDKLQALRELLTDPNHWTKLALSRDKKGNPINSANHPESCCFCLVGGIQHVTLESQVRNMMRRALEAAATQRYQDDYLGLLEVFNDDPETTHAMVLDVIDRAVANA